MKDVVLNISLPDRLRMERIVLDRDGEEALALIKQWLDAAARAGRSGMQSHLDGGAPQ
jgi:hypothetical protein